MHADLAYAGRPRLDMADIVRQHRGALESVCQLTVAQQKVLSAIALCRTEALGGHVDECRSCGYEHYLYHSCRNRHCPRCQAHAQERWIAARTDLLLDAPHFHVVFTLPAELRALAKYRSREIFAALFASASCTLSELARTRLKARLGITMVLHTWTRELRFHPHVHAIVTAGGLGLDGESWNSSGSKFLFPVKVMGALLRGKMMAALRCMQQNGVFDGFDDFDDPKAFDLFMARIARKSWVVYAKKPFREARHVVAYLGRYTHRVAIANSRLVTITDHAVTFRTKNGNTVTLPSVTFLQRFIQHILPSRFHKIRHYGLYSSVHSRSGGLLDAARRLVSSTPSTASAAQLTASQETLWSKPQPCPHCGNILIRRPLKSTAAPSRAPPWKQAS